MSETCWLTAVSLGIERATGALREKQGLGTGPQ